MSIELSVVPESDSDNSDPPKIDVWEIGDSIVLNLEYPKRRISIAKNDLRRIAAFFDIPSE